MNQEGETNLIKNKTAETIDSTLNYKLSRLTFFFRYTSVRTIPILTRAAREVEISDVVNDL